MNGEIEGGLTRAPGGLPRPLGGRPPSRERLAAPQMPYLNAGHPAILPVCVYGCVYGLASIRSKTTADRAINIRMVDGNGIALLVLAI